jgi:pyridoxal phosphate enzyme (YggS family)
MAAIKSADVEEINYLHTALGVTHVGENRVQQLLERYEKLEREGLSIHFIGTLQTNKVKYIIDKVDMIQSLDSEKLAREIEKQAAKVGRVMDVLIEINSGSEISKSGLEPEDTEAFARVVVSGDYPHIRLRGFMTMAPKSTEEEYRAIFGRTRRLCEGIWERLGMTDSMVMSMGMSESYIPAAACGSTMVRVGRGLFVKETDETV